MFHHHVSLAAQASTARMQWLRPKTLDSRSPKEYPNELATVNVATLLNSCNKVLLELPLLVGPSPSVAQPLVRWAAVGGWGS